SAMETNAVCAINISMNIIELIPIQRNMIVRNCQKSQLTIKMNNIPMTYNGFDIEVIKAYLITFNTLTSKCTKTGIRNNTINKYKINKTKITPKYNVANSVSSSTNQL